ncbi:cytochrome c oxidase assembly factor Coa1 family protein [Lacinutrix sp. MEBiC02595]
MNNEIIAHKSWWYRNWKWFTAVAISFILFLFVFSSSGFSGILIDYTKAYTDIELYNEAIEKASINERVIKVLGTIDPIDNMTILNGAVQYSNNNKSILTTIKITCKKGKAMLDISADRINETWHYKKINVRIKKPIEKKEIITIITPTEYKSRF